MHRPIPNLRCISALLICSALSACIPAVRSPVSNIPQSAAPPPRLPVDLVTKMEPEPVWNARQVVPNARTIPESSYIVSPGDTLSGVGKSTGAGSAILAKANGLKTPYVHYPGQGCGCTVGVIPWLSTAKRALPLTAPMEAPGGM